MRHPMMPASGVSARAEYEWNGERFNSAVEAVAYDGETALRLSDVVLNRTGFVALEVAFHRESDD